jgi:hypothetical protein
MIHSLHKFCIPLPIAAVNFTLNVGKVKKNSCRRAHFTFGDLELLLTFDGF